LATVKVIYDREADAAFVYFVTDIPEGGAAHTEPCDIEMQGSSMIVVMDAAGKLIGLEILGASGLLPADVLARADDPID
jgi:uncharacterized protein YuzE